MSKDWNISEPFEYIQRSRYYLINGTKYDRVTSVLNIIDKPALRMWYANAGVKRARHISQTRADIGTTVHKLIEIHLSGEEVQLDNYDDEIKQSILLFQEFQKKNNLIPEGVEVFLWNDEYEYAGTTDFIGMCNGKRMILDWKTSKMIYEEYWLQLSAYVIAFEALTNVKVDGAGILCIRDGTTTFKDITYDEAKKLFEIFIAAKKLNRWKNG